MDEPSEEILFPTKDTPRGVPVLVKDDGRVRVFVTIRPPTEEEERAVKLWWSKLIQRHLAEISNNQNNVNGID
jgi:hypothetical protein